MNLAAVDLNLLVAFRALMAERHVTRAGERVGMSQSGMSNALGRLRELTGNVLFVRAKEGMLPTPFAQELSPRVLQALDIIERALANEAFDPAASDRTYVLAMPDAIEGLLLAPLLRRVTDAAPNVRIAVVPLDSARPSQAKLRSDIDVAVGAIHEGTWHYEALYHETFTVLHDPSATDERVTLARYCKRPHVVWSSSGDLRGHVDAVLAEQQRERTVVASTASFLALPHLIRGSRRLATVPTRVAQMLAAEHGLATARVPLALDPFEIRMAWHPVWDADASASWLRAQLRAAASKNPYQR